MQPQDSIVECVPNFSEGRSEKTVDELVEVIRSASHARVLDREMDVNHHRAVITFAGSVEDVEESAFAAVARARDLIDLRNHKGEHPRMGATDVLPFIPVRNVTMAECVQLARRVGERIGTSLGIPVFLYEEAASRPERKNLADVRQGQFEGLRELIGTDPTRDPDFGPRRIHPSAGAIAVGARFFLIAYNINLRTRDVALAKRIAKCIREKDGGFPCVKAMGFFLEDRGLAQVSMNLTNYRVTPILKVFEEVERLASDAHVEVVESELIGLAPREALPRETLERIRLGLFDPTRQILEELLDQEA